MRTLPLAVRAASPHLALLLATVILLSAGTLMASAQTSQPTPLPEQNWLVNCTNVGTPDWLRCSVTQIVRLKKTGQKLIRVEVIPVQGNQKARMLVGLPHGLFLPDGIKVSVDDGPKTAYLPDKPRFSTSSTLASLQTMRQVAPMSRILTSLNLDAALLKFSRQRRSPLKRPDFRRHHH